MRQLGHTNLAVTTRYIQALSPDEVIDTVYERPAPTMPVSRLLGV